MEKLAIQSRYKTGDMSLKLLPGSGRGGGDARRQDRTRRGLQKHQIGPLLSYLKTMGSTRVICSKLAACVSFFIENLGYGSTGVGISFLNRLQNIQIAKSSAKRADKDRSPGVQL